MFRPCFILIPFCQYGFALIAQRFLLYRVESPLISPLFSPSLPPTQDDLINVYIKRVNDSMVEMFDTVSEAVSIKNFSPAEDLALFSTDVVRPGTPLATAISYERFPNITFTCPAGRIPIVLSLTYKAENCDFDLGAPFRFPCIGTNNTCTRIDLQQFVRSCFTPDPVTPADFLPADFEKYVTSVNYICFDHVAQNLSVLGELIHYPLSGSLDDAANNPGGGELRFEAGLELPIGKFVSAYPDRLDAGFNTVFYIEEASLPKDLCFSESWQTTVNVPPDFRYKWYLCHYLQKNGLTSLTGALSTTQTKIAAMNAKLGSADYAEYSTCQYKAKATNSPTFGPTYYSGAPNQIDCVATDANNGARIGPFSTSCDAALIGGVSSSLGGNYYDDPVQYKYSCQGTDLGSSVAASKTLDAPSQQSTIMSEEGNFKGCLAANNDCRNCCANIFLGVYECCIGGDYDVNTKGDDVFDCKNECPDACLSMTQVGGQPCTSAATSKAARTTEVNKKYETLQTWLSNRQSCASELAACTGKRTCDWSACKPGVLEYILTNELQPRYVNSAVKWVFWGGYKQKFSASYEQQLDCSRASMVPVLMSLEASWGLFTSYGFNVSADVPLVAATVSSSAYYTINPTTLKTTLASRVALPPGTSTVTLRAEYKCLCPPGYEVEMGSFDNITSCTPCINGHYREAGMPACVPCPVGMYENGAHTQCLSCPAGTFNNVTATYYNTTADPPILGCQPCPVLHVSTPGASYCYPCDKRDPTTGSYFSIGGAIGGGPNTYASNSTTCTSCVDHLYTNGTVNSTSIGCVRCERGYYRFQNMTDCDRAPPGTHMNEQFDSYNVYPDITDHSTALLAVLGGQHAAVFAAAAAAERFQRQQHFPHSRQAGAVRPRDLRFCIRVDNVFALSEGVLPAGAGSGALHRVSPRNDNAGLWHDKRYVMQARAARRL